MNRKKNIRYDSDDFSRMAGPDYRQGPAENFELGDEDPVSSRGTNSYPGVSGKTLRGGTWFNHDKYDKQRKFMGKGPKGYRRSDDRIYEEVCEVLTRSHDLDASDIGVTVQHGTVILEGHVDSKKNKIFAEY